VEDEENVRSLVRQMLASNGYTVLTAGDGVDAITLCERLEGELDLLITDVVMPGMSGPAVAERLVAMRPGLKVLFVSGYTDDAVLRHGVREGSTPFLQKPFTLDRLLEKVREALKDPVRTAA
jgi:CheY-like chemotaxis protein